MQVIMVEGLYAFQNHIFTFLSTSKTDKCKAESRLTVFQKRIDTKNHFATTLK
jgi:hypothetical protein